MSNDFDVDAWIESGTVKRTTVTIHNDPAVVEQAESLLAERAQIEARVKEEGGDKSLTDTDPFTDIDAKIEALSDEFEASASEWVLAPVVADEYDRIAAAYPQPIPPRKPMANDADSKWDHYNALLTEWRKKSDAATLAMNIEYVAESVVEVRKGDKVATSITADTVRALRSRPHGKVQFEKLLTEAIAVTNGEVQMPLPKSSTTSTRTPN